jgi:hypothetical protein
MKSTTAALWVNLSIPLSCFLCIFAWPLIPIIVYFSKKDDPFVLAHLKSSTNFAITMMIPAFIGGLLSFIGIGILILVAVVLVEVVYGIKGSQAASRGELYKYPLAIQIFN